MSDPGSSVELWNAPPFEQTAAESGDQSSAGEREALAQAMGFQSGHKEGFAAGKLEAQQIIASLLSVADQMAQPYRELDEIVTRELAQMAMLLARQIVRRELSVDTQIIEGLVEEALATLYKLDGETIIFLNPADAKLLQDFAPESLEGKDWKIVEDANLQAGGCQVKTPTSFVDASVEKRIESVFAGLVEICEQGAES
ncbi:MAG: hypothetical protein CME59_21730 [Halioglobus sp.]|nr:hypothetical protein [Halioglobus sp.]